MKHFSGLQTISAMFSVSLYFLILMGVFSCVHRHDTLSGLEFFISALEGSKFCLIVATPSLPAKFCLIVATPSLPAYFRLNLDFPTFEFGFSCLSKINGLLQKFGQHALKRTMEADKGSCFRSSTITNLFHKKHSLKSYVDTQIYE